MRHKFLVLTVKKWLKSVYIYGSYRKIKTGVPLFLDHSVYTTSHTQHSAFVSSFYRAMHYSTNATRGRLLRLHVVCPSLCPSVPLSVCDVGGPGTYRLEISESNLHAQLAQHLRSS